MQKKDILNRQKDVETLFEITEMLSSRKAAAAFALDGKWGTGKSFILQMFEEKILEQTRQNCGNTDFFIFHYDCWKYDYYEEPLIAIVAAMLDTVEQERVFAEQLTATASAAWKVFVKNVKDIAGKIIENKLGFNGIEFAQNVVEEKKDQELKRREFDSLYSFKETLDYIRQKISELAKQKNIIFIVDELDRCLPEYEIKVLERIHHIFYAIENVTVIIAMDKTQLTYSIKRIFGENTNVNSYLKKFIDFTIGINKGYITAGIYGKYNQYFQLFSKREREEQREFEEFFRTLFYDVDIRTQEKLVEKAEYIHRIVNGNDIRKFFLVCYELLWVRLISIHGKKDLYLSWVLDIASEGMKSQEKEIGSALYSYLSEMMKNMSNGSVSPLMENMIWVLDTLCENRNSADSESFSNDQMRQGRRFVWQEKECYREDLICAFRFVKTGSIMEELYT